MVLRVVERHIGAAAVMPCLGRRRRWRGHETQPPFRTARLQPEPRTLPDLRSTPSDAPGRCIPIPNSRASQWASRLPFPGTQQSRSGPTTVTVAHWARNRSGASLPLSRRPAAARSARSASVDAHAESPPQAVISLVPKRRAMLLSDASAVFRYACSRPSGIAFAVAGGAPRGEWGNPWSGPISRIAVDVFDLPARRAPSVPYWTRATNATAWSTQS